MSGSQVKNQRRAARRARESLWPLLSEHREFLELSATSFDEGFEAEAKRMAVSLRVLLYDTEKSHSLLKQLGVKSRMLFTNTADPIDPRNLMNTPGLVIMQLTSDGVGGSEGRYVAPLGNGFAQRTQQRVPFNGWWQDAVMKESDGQTWSRRDFVRWLANREGGAHVDPRLDHGYEALVRHNSLGWTSSVASTEGVEISAPFQGSPVAASVRQITYEVLETLNRYEALLT